MIWLKKRSGLEGHLLSDSVRGIDKGLYSNQTVTEDYFLEYGKISAVSDTGFTVAVTTNTPLIVNESGQTYVAWAWDAGSSTVTNTSGSISSQVRANTSAGFSVVTYTGTAANATVGHGLGVAPSMVIVKRRNTAFSNWQVRHVSIAPANSIQLNLTNAAAAATTIWNSTCLLYTSPSPRDRG